jgi:hypothetical protein
MLILDIAGKVEETRRASRKRNNGQRMRETNDRKKNENKEGRKLLLKIFFVKRELHGCNVTVGQRSILGTNYPQS